MPYLTKDEIAATVVCRRFRIPTNMLDVFMGALSELALDYRWEQFGTMTALETAEALESVIDDFWEGCMVGSLWYGITTSPPTGVLLLDGSTYDNVDYPLLASVLGGVFDNGDGSFTLPDTRGRTLVGTGQGPGLTNRAIGDSFGAETHQLTIAEMPNHTHQWTDPGINIVQEGLADPVLSDPGNPFSEVGYTGGDAPHNNMPPSLAVHIGVWYQ